MDKYEYEILYFVEYRAYDAYEFGNQKIEASSLTNALNLLGQKGWQLVAQENGKNSYIMMRKIEISGENIRC